MKTAIVHLRLAICVPESESASCIAESLIYDQGCAADTVNEILQDQTMKWSDNSALLDYQIDGITAGPNAPETYSEGEAFTAQAFYAVPMTGPTFDRFDASPVLVLGAVPDYGHPVIQEKDGTITTCSSGCICYADAGTREE